MSYSTQVIYTHSRIHALQIQVQLVVYSCVVVLYQKQGQLNIALVGHGELCAIITGTTKMLLWFVDSWDSQPQVHINMHCNVNRHTADSSTFALEKQLKAIGVTN